MFGFEWRDWVYLGFWIAVCGLVLTMLAYAGDKRYLEPKNPPHVGVPAAFSHSWDTIVIEANCEYIKDAFLYWQTRSGAGCNYRARELAALAIQRGCWR